MQIAATLCVYLASADAVSAFVAAPGGKAGVVGKSSGGRPTSLRMSDPDGKDSRRTGADTKITLTAKQAKTIYGKPASAPERRAPAMSQALPFVKCPQVLDGALAADFGFDPLGFSDNYENLAKYREAEVKHGRLAMLAAAGWPLSELWDANIAQFFGMEPALNPDGRVPSVLNGGMGRVGVAYWIGCVWLAAALDVYGAFFASKKDGYVAGDFGLRAFYPEGEKGQRRMRVAEIKHGRLAMVAITAYAAQEFVSHSAVVDHAAIFFRPITEILSSSQLPGLYVSPEVVTEGISAVAPDAAFVPAVVEATASAVVEAAPAAAEATASAVAEAAGAAPPLPALESLPAASAEAVPPALAELDAANERIGALEAQIATKEELVAAKSRIVNLEAKLAQIETLVR